MDGFRADPGPPRSTATGPRGGQAGARALAALQAATRPIPGIPDRYADARSAGLRREAVGHDDAEAAQGAERRFHAGRRSGGRLTGNRFRSTRERKNAAVQTPSVPLVAAKVPDSLRLCRINPSHIRQGVRYTASN